MVFLSPLVTHRWNTVTVVPIPVPPMLFRVTSRQRRGVAGSTPGPSFRFAIARVFFSALTDRLDGSENGVVATVHGVPRPPDRGAAGGGDELDPRSRRRPRPPPRAGESVAVI
ncbi:hypothetical protein GCM10009662_24150 [Catellatospora coxensis]|uniref:Uncharacterized protein n=1 Tax=Catellatospora coxensis TaxID=310354 RepID=A0A8J3KW09_9ACTN|nr:hypothetical protein Cco03nite_41020 [Catellatospora coxensis]